MYAYIYGKITHIEPTYVVLENQGVGYLIITPNSYRYRQDQEVLIHTHHYVREDIANLYGFMSLDEKKLFIKLISVSGIGPKSALSILASGETDNIVYAIEAADVKYLTKFPGIGPKSAQQIILDLKGKIDKLELGDNASDEVRQALEALGYSNTEITKTIKKLDPNNPIEEKVKQALSLLMK